MYSPSGQKLGTYLISVCNQGANNTTSLTICSALSTSDKYFGGRRLAVMDQLGSAGTYYPWGEAKGSTNPQDAWSYATYWRDSVSGLDYANQRYYSNTYGRFMTPDPYYGSANIRAPQSWNRMPTSRMIQSTAAIPAVCATPWLAVSKSRPGATQAKASLVLTLVALCRRFPTPAHGMVNGAARRAPTTYNQDVEANTVAVAIEAAAADSTGPINIFAFSGGAAATTEAFSMLPASVIARIASITYVSPGSFGVLGTVNGIKPTVIFGGGFEDAAATMISSLLMLMGWNIISTSCGHDFGCEIAAAGGCRVNMAILAIIRLRFRLST